MLSRSWSQHLSEENEERFESLDVTKRRQAESIVFGAIR
jgi:hypothetical protein